MSATKKTAPDSTDALEQAVREQVQKDTSNCVAEFLRSIPAEASADAKTWMKRYTERVAQGHGVVHMPPPPSVVQAVGELAQEVRSVPLPDVWPEPLRDTETAESLERKFRQG